MFNEIFTKNIDRVSTRSVLIISINVTLQGKRSSIADHVTTIRQKLLVEAINNKKETNILRLRLLGMACKHVYVVFLWGLCFGQQYRLSQDEWHVIPYDSEFILAMPLNTSINKIVDREYHRVICSQFPQYSELLLFLVSNKYCVLHWNIKHLI